MSIPTVTPQPRSVSSAIPRIATSLTSTRQTVNGGRHESLATPQFDPYSYVFMRPRNPELIIHIEAELSGNDNSYGNDASNLDGITFPHGRFPDLQHAAWQTGILRKEIRTWLYRWDDTLGDAGDVWANCVELMNTKYAAEGLVFDKYCVNLYPMASGGWLPGHGLDYCPWNQPGDQLSSGDRGSPAVDDSLNRFGPWIESYGSMPEQFESNMAAFKEHLLEKNLPLPEGLSSTQETGTPPIDYWADSPSAQSSVVGSVNVKGWVSRALQDSRSGELIVSPGQTFSQFVQSVRLRNGNQPPEADWRTYQGLNDSRHLMQSPANLLARAPWIELAEYRRQNALYKCMAEPFFNVFGDSARFYQYQTCGMGTGRRGISIAPGTSPVTTQLKLPYQLRAHCPDWYGDMSLGSLMYSRPIGDGNVKQIENDDPTNSPSHQNWRDWMAFILNKWPNPKSAPFDETTLLITAVNSNAWPSNAHADWTVGDFKWCSYVRATMIVYELLVAYPGEVICPWITMTYLKSQRDWDLMQAVIKAWVAMGVRRMFLWEQQYFDINFPPALWSGSSRKKDLLAPFLSELQTWMATFNYS